MANEIHVDDIGTKFVMTVKDEEGTVDVSSALTLEIIFRKPSGLFVTKTASLNTDGTDGKIYYKTETNDLDEVGDWTVQTRTELSAGNDFKSDIGTFPVHSNLE